MVERHVLFARNPLVISIDIFDDNEDHVWIEYDAVIANKYKGGFTFTETPKQCLNDRKQWVTLHFKAQDPRFLGGFRYGDFRIVKQGSPNGQLHVRKVVLIGATTESSAALDRCADTTTAISRSPLAVNPDSIRFKQVHDVETSIVIPVYGRLAYTLQCLRPLQIYTKGAFEIIVVDDASVDHTPKVLRGVASIRLITQPGNMGFAKACNRASREARGGFLVFVNNGHPGPGVDQQRFQ